MRIKAKIEKNTLVSELWLELGQKREKKNTLFGWALVRIRAKIEKNTIFGWALARIRAIIEKKTPLLANIWLEKVKS